MPEQKYDNWSEWANYVLKTLDELKKQHEDGDKKIEGISRETLIAIGKLITKITVLEAKMQQKAAISGGLVGFASSIVVGMIVYFITRG